MMLRSAVTRDAAQSPAGDGSHGGYGVGSYVELRSEDPLAKPWLARISNTRQIKPDEDPNIVAAVIAEEIECEWLWHPSEHTKDIDFDEKYDPGFYGTREVFVGRGGHGDSGRDWNSVDSIKYRVFVFPFDDYKHVAGQGFQLQSNQSDPNAMTILDPARCWYYRQALYIDENNVKVLSPPSLPLVIHRPNAQYHLWCQQRGMSIRAPTLASDPSIPPRSILVPENPERLYFFCGDCQRRFETRHGDCMDPSQLHDSKFARKNQINMEDVAITCPMCKEIKPEIKPEPAAHVPPPSKKARISSGSISTSNELWPSSSSAAAADAGEQEAENQRVAAQARRENQRKQGRYDRVSSTFQKSIQEVVDAGHAGSLKYKDAQTLADLFFDRFEVYSTENQLNTKMEHQKLHEIFQNIKRENNTDLRRRIVTGEMTIDELIAADVKDLAPESLKKRREAEQKKYFQQQVLLSVGPESVRVIRKTHKGLEVVEDEDQPLLERDDSQKPEEADSEGLGTQLSLPDDFSSLPTPAIHNAIPPIQEIISDTFQSRRAAGPPDSDLVDLPFPLAQEWKTAKVFDNQGLVLPEFLGLPNRQQSKALVLSKLKGIGMNEKIIAEISSYADTPAYGLNQSPPFS